MLVSSATRRQFLAATLLSATPAAASAARLAAPTPIVDTHLHCFAGKDDPRFPYHKNGPYAPPAPATPEHLLQCMNEAGVAYAVVVHPEPYQYSQTTDTCAAA